jgi:hypothetical protein
MFRPALRRRTTVLAVTFAATVFATPAIATASTPVDSSTLTPPPPEPYVCETAGTQVRCAFSETVTVDPSPTGITCGTGQGSFEVWDGGETLRIEATRFFDASGRLVERIVHETYLGATWVNASTGASVRYTQSNTARGTYAIPGDTASVTEATTGNAAIFLVPGAGAVMLNAGRTVWVFDPAIDDLRLVSWAGPQAFVQVFVDGDPSPLQAICAALE